MCTDRLFILSGAKILPDRGEIAESRPSAASLSVAVAAAASPPPLELRKKSSPAPHGHVNDAPLITSPYVQNSRAFYYDEPHRTSQSSRIRLVSTPPYTGKVPLPVDSVDIYHPAQSRLYETSTGPRYVSHLGHEDDDNGTGERLPGRRSYPDSSYPGARSVSLDERVVHRDSELEYSRRDEIALCESAVLCSRDSSPSQMNSPPLGDSPPQGNLDGTVLVVSILLPHFLSSKKWLLNRLPSYSNYTQLYGKDCWHSKTIKQLYRCTWLVAIHQWHMTPFPNSKMVTNRCYVLRRG